MDPRGEHPLALICLDHADLEAIEQLKPIIEVISTNVASAITTVRLEQMLRLFEERTRDIRTIFENINQGICMVDAGMRIGRNLSRHMLSLFGDSISGQNVMSVLESTSLSADQCHMVLAVLEVSIGYDVTAFEVNEPTLPRESQFVRDGQTRHLEFDWTAILDRNEVIQRIMLTVRDVTEFYNLREAAAFAALEVGYFREVLSSNPRSLDGFFRDSRCILQTIKSFASQEISLDDAGKNSLKRDIHTLKGTGRMLKLTSITESIHHLETIFIEFSSCEESRISTACHSLRDISDEIDTRMANYITIMENLRAWSGPLGQEGRNSSISECLEILEDVENNLSEYSAKASLRKAKGHLIAFENPSLQGLIENVFVTACDIATNDLGKIRPHLHCDIPDIWLIKADAARTISDSLNHIFRNMVDHGFGAEEEGTISVKCTKDQNSLYLTISSSEEGIDLAALAEKHRSRMAANSTDDEIAELVFLPGVSTAEFVTKISGRGIGMDAVRSMLSDLRGSIRIEFCGSRNSRGRRPFRFEIQLPSDLIEFEYLTGIEYQSEVNYPKRRIA